MRMCPRCQIEGRPQEIAVALTRWTDKGTETTLRCARCGWQGAEKEAADQGTRGQAA